MSVWSVFQNFDEVLVPADHVSRNPNDTYYIDTETVLRCHTSAHQAETLRKGERAFLVTGVLTEPASMHVHDSCTFAWRKHESLGAYNVAVKSGQNVINLGLAGFLQAMCTGETPSTSHTTQFSTKWRVRALACIITYGTTLSHALTLKSICFLNTLCEVCPAMN